SPAHTPAHDLDRPLHGPARLRVEPPPDDPVHPRLPRARRAGREEDEAVVQLEARPREATDELMQPVVVEEVAELFRVLGLERHEHKALGGDDRRLYRRRAHAPAFRPDSIAPSMNPAQPFAKSLPARRTSPSGDCTPAGSVVY